MNDLQSKLAIAAATGLVGFFWLLAYKHPRSFKAVSAPFAFIAIVALVGTFGFAIACMVFSENTGSYSGVLSDITDRKLSEPAQHKLDALNADMISRALYVGGSAVGLLAFLGFFGWVGRLVEQERKQPKEDKGNQTQEEPKHES